MSLPGARTAWDWRAFAVAGIPVTFSAWYLLLVWACLARAGAIERGFVHLVALTVSVLVHELGHGLVAKRYGLEPRILLHGFGGWCEHRPAHHRDHAFRITAAGPGAGLVLGAAAWALGHAVREAPWWVDLGLQDLAWMGLFWSLVNLLPILPMDGGSLLENLLERSRRIEFPSRTTRAVGVVTAAGAGIVSVVYGEITLLILFVLLGWDNASALGWAPRIPGVYTVAAAPAAGRAVGGYRPRWAVFGLLVALGVPALARGLFDVEPTLTRWLALQAGATSEIWRLLTYPLAPVGRPLTLLSALLAVWLTAPSVERVRGPRAAALLACAATLGSGLAGAAVAPWFPGGVLAGPVATVLAFVAAWASLRRAADLGPSSLPIRPLVLLAVIVVVDLADRWRSGDGMGAAADVAAVAAGLVFAGATGPRKLWQRFELWWKLRNPPPVQISSNRPR